MGFCYVGQAGLELLTSAYLNLSKLWDYMREPLYLALQIYYFIWASKQPYEVSTITSILQIRKLILKA